MAPLESCISGARDNLIVAAFYYLYLLFGKQINISKRVTLIYFQEQFNG